MTFSLLNHSWLSFWRSKSLGRSLGTTIFTWLMVGLMLLYAVGAGYMLETILGKVAPEKDPIQLLNGVLLFYWMFELIFRIIIQKNATLNVQYYLTQRISRQSLAHFMLLKSWVNLFLLITVLFFSRFAFHKIGIVYGAQQSWVWLLFILGVSFCLHHIVIIIHQITKGRFLLPFSLAITLSVIMYASFQGYININFITENLMQAVLANGLWVVVPFIISTGLYLATHFLIRDNLALDNLPQETSVANAGVPSWVQYLNSYGIMGQLVSIDLRLIWRNKRPRMVIIMAPLMVAYFVVFLSREKSTEIIGDLVMLICTGAFMINYGQLLLSWESKYFDCVVTRQFSMEQYLKSKFILLFGFNTFSLLVCGISLFFIDQTLYLDLVMWYLVNIGLFIYLFIWVSLFGSKRIDPNASAMFNYEGIKFTQFLIIIPYFVVPIGAKYFIDQALGEGLGAIVLGSVSIIALVLYNPIMKMLARVYDKRKYKILVGLRE